ncbi:acetolactate synthase small subunit [Clostridium fermenticellae]|uniref:Acetolactate synthase small subunit n=1 Tax=Clostridium fermenticellae TaxID=2068654 RepID=A0A386H372_9CLOT|nr:acetolactate synthase small subunit [Clostridium fermenticellae]AYD40152.1 acetolactate synthase small subunit [Clostridium fermenticellae]
MNKYVLSLLVENHSGTLSKIASLFSRRGYNIHSLNVGITEDPTISYMTIVTFSDEYTIEQMNKQLNKLIDVIKITELNADKCVYRELLLIKVHTNIQNQSALIELVNIFKGKIIGMNNSSMTIEVTGDEDKISTFIGLMKPYGIKEIVRTGLTAIER